MRCVGRLVVRSAPLHNHIVEANQHFPILPIPPRNRALNQVTYLTNPWTVVTVPPCHASDAVFLVVVLSCFKAAPSSSEVGTRVRFHCFTVPGQGWRDRGDLTAGHCTHYYYCLLAPAWPRQGRWAGSGKSMASRQGSRYAGAQARCNRGEI